MEMDPPTRVLISALIALLATIAIPSLVKVSRAFKRSQQWGVENGHGRAGRREGDWYRQTDSEKLRKLAVRRH